MINFLSRSLQSELNALFQAIFRLDVGSRIVTASAFCQARRKIQPEVFIVLGRHLIRWLRKHSFTKTWRSHHVFAIDGTSFRINTQTDEIKDYFGTVKGPPQSEPQALAYGSHVFDVLGNVTWDAIIAPYRDGESALAQRHLSHLKNDLPQGSLFLLDRGYGDFKLFQTMASLGCFFCVRAKNDWKVVKALKKSGLSEGNFLFHLDKARRKEFKEDGRSFEPIPVRVLAIALITGEVEYLMTTLLDSKTYPRHLFQELYHQRWDIEENYKTKKCRVQIENFTGKSLQTIFQDFHAKVFAENLVAMMVSIVADEVEASNMDKHHQYKINFAAALAKMKFTMVLLFLRSRPDHLVDDLLKLLVTDLSSIRPGRVFKRKNRGKDKRGITKSWPKIQHKAHSYKSTF